MRPYALKFLPKDDVRLFRNVRSAIRLLPDIDLGQDEQGKRIIISCHLLARAVSTVFHLEHVDGAYYTVGYYHSWVLTPHRNIIDVYPIGAIGGPLLHDGQHPSPAARQFIRIDENVNRNKYAKFAKPSFIEATRRLTREVHRLSLPLNSVH